MDIDLRDLTDEELYAEHRRACWSRNGAVRLPLIVAEIMRRAIATSPAKAAALTQPADPFQGLPR